jgi:hypothetical protein
LKGNRLKPVLFFCDQSQLWLGCTLNFTGQRQFEKWEKNLRNVAFGCYSLLLNTISWTEARSKNLGRLVSEVNHC